MSHRSLIHSTVFQVKFKSSYLSGSSGLILILNTVTSMSSILLGILILSLNLIEITPRELTFVIESGGSISSSDSSVSAEESEGLSPSSSVAYSSSGVFD